MSGEISFDIGDAVRLRVEGSPSMVVEAIDAQGRVICAWTDGAGHLQSHAFPPGSLRLVEPAPKGPAAAQP